MARLAYCISFSCLFTSSPVFFPSFLSFLRLPFCPSSSDLLAKCLSLPGSCCFSFSLSSFFCVFSYAYCDFSTPSHFPFHFFTLPHLRLACTSEVSVCFASFPVFATALPTDFFLMELSCMVFLTSLSAWLLILDCCFGSITLLGFSSTCL